MNWEPIKSKLELILNTSLRLVKLSTAEWSDVLENSQLPSTDPWQQSYEYNNTLLFYLDREGVFVHALELGHVLLTVAERQLMEMLIEAYRSKDKKQGVQGLFEDENKALAISDWISQQLKNGVVNEEMPDYLTMQSVLCTNVIPIMLHGGFSSQRKVSYLELKKLLEAFFDSDIILIQIMEREWLILGAETLLTETKEEEKNGEEESVEEALEALCFGLYGMMTSEVGECHLSIAYPIVPAKSLLATVIELREAIMLGRTYRVGNNIHLPWLMHLDRLLNALPEADKNQFVDHILKKIEHFLDAEMLQTLEHFFDLDCNVSETAKVLYIHRNTLLYRLDKFKQETGLDIRSFHDAVLVRIAVSLYKVTKRK